MLTKQQQLVLYLTSHGSINHDTAKQVCGIKNLRAEINRLRNLGYNIATQTNLDGETEFYLISRKAVTK
jgi:hypothetical protein